MQFNTRVCAIAASVTVTALLLAGCNESSATSDKVTTRTVTAAPNSSVSSATDDETSDDATEADTTDESADQVLAYGDTYTSKNGWSVTVSKPKVFRKGEYAAGGEGFSAFRVVTVTLSNKTTGKSLDPSSIYISATADDRQADEVFDDSVGEQPTAKVLPGRTVKWKQAFGAVPGKKLSIQIEDQSEWDSPAIIFDGTA